MQSYAREIVHPPLLLSSVLVSVRGTSHPLPNAHPFARQGVEGTKCSDGKLARDHPHPGFRYRSPRAIRIEPFSGFWHLITSEVVAVQFHLTLLGGLTNKPRVVPKEVTNSLRTLLYHNTHNLYLIHLSNMAAHSCLNLITLLSGRCAWLPHESFLEGGA